MYVIIVGAISAAVTGLLMRFLVSRFRESELLAVSSPSSGSKSTPQLGGIALIFGLTSGILVVVAFETFLSVLRGVQPVPVLMVLLTTYLVAQIGLLNDLIEVRRGIRALAPLLASVPLMVIQSGQSSLGVPFISWRLEVGLIYPLVLIPLGITGAANAVNLLSTYNGMASGMGVVAFTSLTVIAYSVNSPTAILILVAALGATLVSLYYNWFPAKIIISDIGAFTIGAIIASAAILGNFEFAGIIVIGPYALDLLIRGFRGFPSEGWKPRYEQGEFYCPERGPASLPQLVMKLSGGMSERGLALSLIGLEVLFGAGAVLFYLV